MQHFFNRSGHEQRGIIRHGIVNIHIRREVGRQFFQAGLYGFGRSHRVCTRGQEHRHRHRRLAVKTAVKFIRLAAQFNAGHIFESKRSTVRIGAQNNLAKFFRFGKAAGGHNRVHPIYRYRKRRLADFTRRALYVLRFDGGNNITDGQAALGKHIRLNPNTDGIVVGGHYLGIPHAFNTF